MKAEYSRHNLSLFLGFPNWGLSFLYLYNWLEYAMNIVQFIKKTIFKGVISSQPFCKADNARFALTVVPLKELFD